MQVPELGPPLNGVYGPKYLKNCRRIVYRKMGSTTQSYIVLLIIAIVSAARFLFTTNLRTFGETSGPDCMVLISFNTVMYVMFSRQTVACAELSSRLNQIVDNILT